MLEAVIVCSARGVMLRCGYRVGVVFDLLGIWGVSSGEEMEDGRMGGWLCGHEDLMCFLS